MDTKLYFSSWLWYIPSIALILFSAISSLFIFKDDNIISKINRFYYSVCMLAYVLIVKNINLVSISSSSFLGIRPKFCSIITFTIIYFLIILLIDNIIISGYSFKEFGILGAKFIRDDTKATVIEQDEYIFSLENGFSALQDTFNYMETFFSEQQTKDDIKNSKFDYTLNLHDIIEHYYRKELLSVNIDFTIYDSSDIKSTIIGICNKYTLSNKNMHKLKSGLSNNSNSCCYINNTSFNIYIVPQKSSHLNNPFNNIFIEIKSFKKLNVYDKYILSCIFKQYELYLFSLS